MMNKFNPISLKQLIDKVKEKWQKETYFGGVTTVENIRSRMIAETYLEVLGHIGLSEYDGEKKYGDMNSRRMAELVDMVDRHLKGGGQSSGISSQ